MYTFKFRQATEAMIRHLLYMNINQTIVTNGHILVTDKHILVTDKHILVTDKHIFPLPFFPGSITDLMANKCRIDPLQVHQAFPCRGGSYRCFRLSRVGPLVPFPFLITYTER